MSTAGVTPFAFPPGFETWWSTTYEVPPSCIDEFGHMSAVHYPSVVDHATARFVVHALDRPLPDYVMAELGVVYRHEVRLDRSPLRIHVRPIHVGRTTFAIRAILVDSAGVPCTQGDIRYVAWDRQARTKRAMPDDERSAFESHLA